MQLPISAVPGPSDAPAVHAGRPFDVLLILPPDQDLSSVLRCHKFPPQGPAMVAASLAPDNIRCRVADIDRSIFLRPVAGDLGLADDEALVAGHLQGRRDARLEALVDELIGRIDRPEACDAFGLSLERYPQIAISVLLGQELKRRFGKPVVIGGSCADPLAFITRASARGIDFATMAAIPPVLRRLFDRVRELPGGRWELAAELPDLDQADFPPDDYPVPDFSIYDLDAYRRDPFAADGATNRDYDGSVGPQLVLGYNLVFNCLYACTFCGIAKTPQRAKSPAKVVRDFATLAEKIGAFDFALMDTQINLEAPALADALIAANLGVRFSDSYRVAPSKPGTLEKLARAGCVSLTFGVESGNDRILKKMLKGYAAKDATRVLREAHDAGLMLRVNLLPCFPGESREEFVDTREWLRENAFAIEDLSASSYYLLKGTQVGQNPEKFGVELREARELKGELRVRKNVGSLMYDEPGGMRWEEREPLLESTEEELRDTWRQTRAALGHRVAQAMTISHMHALGRAFPSKTEALQAIRRWETKSAPGDHGGPPGEVTGAPAVPPRLIAPAAPAAPLAERFDAAIQHALPELSGLLGRNLAGHMLLFDDGDYLCFQGLVDPLDAALPRRVRVDNVLASRFDGTRRRVYGRFRPGVTVEILAGAIRAGEGSGRWEEELRLGEHYDLLSFAP